MDIEALQIRLRQFRDDRDWAHLHTSQNLAQALSVEAGELLECFLWGKDEMPFDGERVAGECADVFIYLLQICDSCHVDLEIAVDLKIRANAHRFPVQQRLPRPL
jgi:NTP pyrophosphatase (non-canonical NTP hydrolase)